MIRHAAAYRAPPHISYAPLIARALGERATPSNPAVYPWVAVAIQGSNDVSDRGDVSFPFNTGCLPLKYSGDPGVNGASDRGVHRTPLGVGEVEAVGAEYSTCVSPTRPLPSPLPVCGGVWMQWVSHMRGDTLPCKIPHASAVRSSQAGGGCVSPSDARPPQNTAQSRGGSQVRRLCYA